MKMNNKEWMIFIVLVLSFALMGTTGGVSGTFAFAGLGLVIWLIWRGRNL